MGLSFSFEERNSGISPSSISVCQLIADRLLQESNITDASIIQQQQTGISPDRNVHNGIQMELVEAAVWLLRSCGEHERAIEIIFEYMNNPSLRNRAVSGRTVSKESGSALNSKRGLQGKRGAWSQIKFESFVAAHLGDLWSSADEGYCDLVLKSKATRQLLEINPKLGLSIFTETHPKSSERWQAIDAKDDPLVKGVFPIRVLELLKSIRPVISENKNGKANSLYPTYLPLESGRALAATFLESAIGISSGRPPNSASDDPLSAIAYQKKDEGVKERISYMHDELMILLLEGVLSERSDSGVDDDSELGKLYRQKLHTLLEWPNAKVNPDRLMTVLPSTFLREKALLLGRLGHHKKALRIFYSDLGSLDLALEYCDARFERQRVQNEHDKRTNEVIQGAIGKSNSRHIEDAGCAYLPLISVALESKDDAESGIAAAIQVLSLRRNVIDRSAALHLIPKSIPVSALSRNFLIPSLIESDSQVRRLTIVSSLYRAKYLRLKHALTDAQIKSQSTLHGVPALRQLNLGELIYSSKPFKARVAHSSAPHFPDVTIIKHFFPRYVIIQAIVTNSAVVLEGRALGEVSLVVAESSDEALLPSINVSIKILPSKATGSSWYALAASPQRLDGAAILACEMRYTVLSMDSATGAPLSFNSGFASVGSGRSFVEEIQDLEVRRGEFDM